MRLLDGDGNRIVLGSPSDLSYSVYFSIFCSDIQNLARSCGWYLSRARNKSVVAFIVMQMLQPEALMQGDNPISWLMFFTLAATIFIIAGAFIYFLRSRTNREIAAQALEGNNSRIGATPNGAGAELVGFAVIGIAVMGLLTVGYARKPKVETAAVTTPVGQTTGISHGMAQPVGSSNQPKAYQPVNPAPDPRSAPTSSDAGVGDLNGPQNGSTGQAKN
jgi:hypothetical protein